MKRDKFKYGLDLGDEILADNFAGGGGASEAIRQAFGRDPDVAINHDGEALCMHHANHPTTRHYVEDVFLINPTLVTRNRPVGAVWFSPTCTHFSKAKGFNILNQKTRGLAWVVIKWAHDLAPRTMYLENVEEFTGWGPLDDKGRPIKEHKGRTFQAFIAALTTGIDRNHPDLPEIVDALGEDFPLERLYAGLGFKVEWKVLRADDFGAGTKRRRLFMVMRRDGLPICWPDPTHGDPKSPGVLAGKLLPKITTADSIDWSLPCPSIFERKRPLRPATLRRVGRGFERYVKDAENPYIVPGGDQHAQVAAHVTKFNTGSIGHGCDESLATITSGGGAARPAGAAHGLGIVAASLVQYYSGGGQNTGVDTPMPTIVTKDRIGVTCAYLAKHYTGVIGASVAEPLPTITTVDHNSLITAHLIGIDHQSRGDNVAWGMEDPLTTITTENRHAIVTSNLVSLRGTSTAASVDEPLNTITAGGTHHGEVRTTFARTPASIERRQTIREFLWEYCPSLKGVECPELVTIHGEVMEVVDIGLRMLQPRELANAQGLPRDYVLDPFYTYVNKKGKTITKRLSKSAQTRMIGNSVSPPPAVAVLRANNTYELEFLRAA